MCVHFLEDTQLSIPAEIESSAVTFLPRFKFYFLPFRNDADSIGHYFTAAGDGSVFPAGR
jgi:hypothetical protein